jgi:antitoxin (DNA-binding transcriptional repressor) of toxin-antitoxin stability system
MAKTIISVTEAARNFADCVNRAHYQNVTFVLVKNGSPVARIVPDGGKLCDGNSLAEAIRTSPLSSDEVKAWRKETGAARKSVKTPMDKWS